MVSMAFQNCNEFPIWYIPSVIFGGARRPQCVHWGGVAPLPPLPPCSAAPAPTDTRGHNHLRGDLEGGEEMGHSLVKGYFTFLLLTTVACKVMQHCRSPDTRGHNHLRVGEGC